MCYSSFLMDSCGIEKTFLPALGNYSLLYSFFLFFSVLSVGSLRWSYLSQTF